LNSDPGVRGSDPAGDMSSIRGHDFLIEQTGPEQHDQYQQARFPHHFFHLSLLPGFRLATYYAGFSQLPFLTKIFRKGKLFFMINGLGRRYPGC
jgi:hypothetical protein